MSAEADLYYVLSRVNQPLPETTPGKRSPVLKSVTVPPVWTPVFSDVAAPARRLLAAAVSRLRKGKPTLARASHE